MKKQIEEKIKKYEEQIKQYEKRMHNAPFIEVLKVKIIELKWVISIFEEKIKQTNN